MFLTFPRLDTTWPPRKWDKLMWLEIVVKRPGGSSARITSIATLWYPRRDMVSLQPGSGTESTGVTIRPSSDVRSLTRLLGVGCVL